MTRKSAPPEPPAHISDRAAELERIQRKASDESARKAQEARERIDAKLAAFVNDEDLEDTTGVRNLAAMVQPVPPDVAAVAAVMEKVDEPAHGPETKRPAVLDAEKPRDERIVVVEDDGDIASTLAETLVGEGYKVRVAVDGIDALVKILRDKPAPDVIILDLGLPFLSGQGVIAALQTTAYADIPVLIVSAGRPDSMPPETLRDYVFIAKPFQLDLLLKTVRERIAEYRLRPRRSSRPFF